MRPVESGGAFPGSQEGTGHTQTTLASTVPDRREGANDSTATLFPLHGAAEHRGYQESRDLISDGGTGGRLSRRGLSLASRRVCVPGLWVRRTVPRRRTRHQRADRPWPQWGAWLMADNPLDDWNHTSVPPAWQAGYQGAIRRPGRSLERRRQPAPGNHECSPWETSDF